MDSSKWVDAKREPEDLLDVLALDKDGGMFIAYWEEKRGIWRESASDERIENVKWWMELPDCPEKEGK